MSKQTNLSLMQTLLEDLYERMNDAELGIIDAAELSHQFAEALELLVETMKTVKIHEERINVLSEKVFGPQHQSNNDIYT